MLTKVGGRAEEMVRPENTDVWKLLSNPFREVRFSSTHTAVNRDKKRRSCALTRVDQIAGGPYGVVRVHLEPRVGLRI